MQLRYHDDEADRPEPRRPQPRAHALRPFTPPVDRDAIFRQLIDQELRRGRLNKPARARIVRYACGMGLSATRAGELVRERAERISRECEAPQREFALRVLHETEESGCVATPLLFAIGVAAALLAYMLWYRFS